MIQLPFTPDWVTTIETSMYPIPYTSLSPGLHYGFLFLVLFVFAGFCESGQHTSEGSHHLSSSQCRINRPAWVVVLDDQLVTRRFTVPLVQSQMTVPSSTRWRVQ